MSIFDKFSDDAPKQFQHIPPREEDKWKKELGQQREELAIKDIKSGLTSPTCLLHGLHFIEPHTNDVCEIDGLYVSKQCICIVEIKSKNFKYLYGNTDTGYWYLEYDNKTVRSDNVYRQITRQMRILEANLGTSIPIKGHIYLNNKIKDVRVDIIGPQPTNISLHQSVLQVREELNKYTSPNPNLVDLLTKLDKENKKKIPKDWVK